MRLQQGTPPPALGHGNVVSALFRSVNVTSRERLEGFGTRRRISAPGFARSCSARLAFNKTCPGPSSFVAFPYKCKKSLPVPSTATWLARALAPSATAIPGSNKSDEHVAVSARAADAKELWVKNCAKCHGEDGKGKTKMGEKLGVKDYTDAKVQADLKDNEMTKAIKEGVKEKDSDKIKMKAFGETFSPDEIKALVAHVRSLKK